MKLRMQLQGFIKREPVLRLAVFSVSIFFILLLFPLRQDSFLQSNYYNSYSIFFSVVDKVHEKDTALEIQNISTLTDAPSFIPSNKTKINTSEKTHNFQKSNLFKVVDKVMDITAERHIPDLTASTIVTPNSSKEAQDSNAPEGKNNLQDRKDHNPLMNHSYVHDSSSSTSVPPASSNVIRYDTSEGEKHFQNNIDAPVKGDEYTMKQQLSRLVRGPQGLAELESTGISCESNVHLDLCVIGQPIILEKKNKSFNIYVPSSKSPRTKRVIRPYPKKEDSNTMMNWVSPVNIIQGDSKRIKPPSCQVKHNVPVLVFSFGGFTDNNYHKFSEVIIPIFVTSRHFELRVQFAVTDNTIGEANWKFRKLLKRLSPYDIIDAHAVNDKRVHCFPSAVAGIRYFDNLEINSNNTPRGYSMADFREFLRESYNLKVARVLKPRRPKVLLISRQKTRSFLNEDKIMTLMKKLGFRIQKVKPNQMVNLDKFSKLVNSCDMMVGVHGAGLTNEIFLPDGAVVIQIVPLGLEWGSEHYYAKPAQNMGLKYLEYKIEPSESSLYDVYGPNNPIVSNPSLMWDKGYGVVKDLYLDRQQVTINLTRFRSTLLVALRLLG